MFDRRTEAARDELTILVRDLRTKGDKAALGRALTDLADSVKHVGTPDGENAFAASARLGSEAVSLLRETGDRKGLSRALRVAAVPMIEGIDHRAMLEESLSLARAIADREEEGWTLLRMTRADGVKRVTIEEALKCFEDCGSLEGQASCLLVMGFECNPRQPELIRRAAQLFREAGNMREADRAEQIARLAQAVPNL